MHTPFVLLDDDTASSAKPTSRLYTELAGVFACKCGEDLPALFAFLQQALQDDRAGLIDQAVKLFGMGVPLQEINTLVGLGLGEIAGTDVGYLG
jgi:hypothetical protein